MPVIGISCYVEPARWGSWDMPAALVPKWYVELLQTAGALVVILPPEQEPSVLDRLDGLVLVGGADVDSERYGQAPHSTADTPRTARDASEFALYEYARSRDIPFLGICRGLQVMAIAHGGTLIQDLPSIPDTGVHRDQPGQFVQHGARLAPNSRIAEIFDTTDIVVNSSHHQAVDSPGDLTVTGWATDGTIEVCENTANSFCIGVQWHPEHPDRRDRDLPLVRAFVEAARVYSGVT